MKTLVDITPDNLRRLKKALLAIENASFPSPWSLQAFREEARRPMSFLWGLIEDGSLVGYACFWLLVREIHLMNIAVHPERRGRGLGSYLLSRIMEEGRTRRVETVWLEVRPSNRNAIRLYRKLGFKEIHRRPRYYTDTHEDAIVMSLRLPCGGSDVRSSGADSTHAELSHTGVHP